MGEYFTHWLRKGQRLSQPPQIFRVNWFRMDAEGKFLWPGFGENLRVLRWVLGRVHGEIGAVETPIGYVPHLTGIDVTGLDISPAALQDLFTIDRAGWLEAVNGQQELFRTFGHRLPRELWHESEALAQRLQA
jgi:phosphoenolpyruvate carboxykinase (GTP)